MNQTLLPRLQTDHPELRFVSGKKFAFRPPRTIVIGPEEPRDDLLLLHELGHALSRHQHFTSDAARLKLEVAAWAKAEELAAHYQVPWDEELVQTELDTYRDWLHSRSRCPHCGLTRYQTTDGAYHCPRCDAFTTQKQQQK